MTDDDAVDTGHQADRQNEEEVTGAGCTTHSASPASSLCAVGRALIAFLQIECKRQFATPLINNDDDDDNHL